MNEKAWQEYATCWSTPQEKARAALRRQVSDDVRYRDPSTEVAGVDELASYMEGFQKAFPANRFEIRRVVAHHGRSAAFWSHLDAKGNTVQEGVSFAFHDATGRMCDITGFF